MANDNQTLPYILNPVIASGGTQPSQVFGDKYLTPALQSLGADWTNTQFNNSGEGGAAGAMRARDPIGAAYQDYLDSFESGWQKPLSKQDWLSQVQAKSAMDQGGIGTIQANSAAANYAWQNYLASLNAEQKQFAAMPVAKKTNGGGDAANLSAEINQLIQNTGGKYSLANKAGDNAAQVSRLTSDLARYGVTSLNDLSAYQMPALNGKGTTDVFYNTKTNQIIPTNFGDSMKGQGGSDFYLVSVNGRVVPVTQWRDTSERSDVLGALSVLGMAFTAGGSAALSSSIGAALAPSLSTTAQAAIGNALVSGATQGVVSAATGGDFLKGFATGAIGSGIGSAVSAANPGGYLADQIVPLGNTAAEAGLNAAVGSSINKALAGSVGAAVGAAIQGGDSASAGLRGAIQGGISGIVGQYTGNQISNQIGSVVSKVLVPNTPVQVSSGSQAGTAANASAAPSSAQTSATGLAPTGFGTGALQITNPAVAQYGANTQQTPRRGMLAAA